MSRAATPRTAYSVRDTAPGTAGKPNVKASIPHSQSQHDFFPEIDVRQPSPRVVRYEGTDNPREHRALDLLLRRPSVPREVLDREAGCSNGPDLIARLRSYGLGKDHLPCTRVTVIDRDGCCCRIGVYHLTPQGRRAVWLWLRKPRQRSAA